MIRRKFLKSGFMLGLATLMLGQAAPAHAESLMERVKAGKPVRIGFANEVPWAYPGENNKPLGFVNAHTIGVLHKMGIKNIKPVITEWGGLIPGLKANRFDIITGGMYILKERCENVAFSDPMGVVGDAFIVPKGNPKGVQTYKDILKNNLTFVTGAGYNQIKQAKKAGIEGSDIMTVPGPTEILAAVKAGRAYAGGMTFFTAKNLADKNPDAVDVTDPRKLPEWTKNWVGIAFRPSDSDFVKAFNVAQKAHLGTDEMLADVKEYGYTVSQLPAPAISTEYVCGIR